MTRVRDRVRQVRDRMQGNGAEPSMVVAEQGGWDEFLQGGGDGS
jgi:hypothetical protein